VPIAGASQNGMSNSFPKVSPDGRWLVFVKCRNAQLMRPDSQLYIVPAEGGVARRMRCNTLLMNSWHSFSPNGCWLVFSSKSRSPYTQMYLTHIDEEGNDSPAILIDNATAANRAVNIPEFVNIRPDGMLKIDVPAAESYRLFDVASELTAKGQLDEAIAVWKKVLEIDPGNAKAQSNLGVALLWQGNLAEGMTHMQKAMELDPNFSVAQSDFGIEFYYREQFRAALRNSDCRGAASYGDKILAVAPEDGEVKKALAGCALKQNRQQMRTALQNSEWQAALSYAHQILALEPGDAEAQKAVKDCTLAVSHQAVH
jgi:tetratricopeptide (TPR) repeat protein